MAAPNDGAATVKGWGAVPYDQAVALPKFSGTDENTHWILVAPKREAGHSNNGTLFVVSGPTANKLQAFSPKLKNRWEVSHSQGRPNLIGCFGPILPPSVDWGLQCLVDQALRFDAIPNWVGNKSTAKTLSEVKKLQQFLKFSGIDFCLPLPFPERPTNLGEEADSDEENSRIERIAEMVHRYVRMSCEKNSSQVTIYWHQKSHAKQQEIEERCCGFLEMDEGGPTLITTKGGPHPVLHLESYVDPRQPKRMKYTSSPSVLRVQSSTLRIGCLMEQVYRDILHPPQEVRPKDFIKIYFRMPTSGYDQVNAAVKEYGDLGDIDCNLQSNFEAAFGHHAPAPRKGALSYTLRIGRSGLEVGAKICNIIWSRCLPYDKEGEMKMIFQFHLSSHCGSYMEHFVEAAVRHGPAEMDFAKSNQFLSFETSYPRQVANILNCMVEREATMTTSEEPIHGKLVLREMVAYSGFHQKGKLANKTD